MSSREHSALHDVYVRTRPLHDVRSLLGAAGHSRHRTRYTRRLDGLDSLRDQLRLDGLAVGLLQDGVDCGAGRRSDLLDDRGRVLIARMDAVEVEDSDTAELAHRDREIDVDHAIHRRTPKGQLQSEPLDHRKRDVDLVRIQSHTARDESDLVESVRAARPPSDPDLEIPTNFEALP